MRSIAMHEYDSVAGGIVGQNTIKFINGPFILDTPYGMGGNYGGGGGAGSGGTSGNGGNGGDYLINVVSGIYGVAATAGCTDLTAGAAPNVCRGVGVAVGATAKEVITQPRDYPVRVTGTMP